MFLQNRLPNTHKGRLASKKALLATASFIILGGVSKARVEVETQSDSFGVISPMATKQHDTVTDAQKSAAMLLEQPSLNETLANLSVALAGFMKESGAIETDLQDHDFINFLLAAKNNPESAAKLFEHPSLEGLKNVLTPVVEFANEANIITTKDTKEKSKEKYDRKTIVKFLKDSGRLRTKDIRDFSNFAYSVDKKEGWTHEDAKLCNKLINEGWVPIPFNGTTGTASNQVESASGFIAFRGKQVVIATRGTEMTNWNDWFTNFRASDGPDIGRFLSAIGSAIGGLFSGNESANANATEQAFLGNLTEKEVKTDAHPGFLQTHLSSWDAVREAILQHAKKSNIPLQDMRFTITGHSLGGAKAQLNAVWLAQMLGLENANHIETVVFGSPRVFGQETAEQIEEILGKFIFRIENNDPKLFQSLDILDLFGDIVTLLPPEWFGYRHVGQRIGDKNLKGFFMSRHMMENISKEALHDTDAARACAIVQYAFTNAIAPADPQTDDTSNKTVQKIDEFKHTQAISRVKDALSNLQKIIASKAADRLKQIDASKTDDGQMNVLVRTVKNVGSAFTARFFAPQIDLSKTVVETSSITATPAA